MNAHSYAVPFTVCMFLLAGFIGGCPRGPDRTEIEVTQSLGDPAHGEQVIRDKHCGSCHRIPGVRGAAGRVGPPLDGFANRSYIAGEVPNTPANLQRWVIAPQSIEPTTAMPAVGLSERDARDVVAYLYTLQ